MKEDISLNARESKMLIKGYMDHTLQKEEKKGKPGRNRINIRTIYITTWIQEKTETMKYIKSFKVI